MESIITFTCSKWNHTNDQTLSFVSCPLHNQCVQEQVLLVDSEEKISYFNKDVLTVSFKDSVIRAAFGLSVKCRRPWCHWSRVVLWRHETLFHVQKVFFVPSNTFLLNRWALPSTCYDSGPPSPRRKEGRSIFNDLLSPWQDPQQFFLGHRAN